ncbi:MAG TPA: acyl-phosphate glycerol 3-phosphate acyltransferase [Opitutae bacterium]|nr:acyl-phosphate glycerol 3-phosphate acyltransferase [Opitutae bacterium]
MSKITILELVSVCVIGYLLGSISFGVLVGNYCGVDPLKKGSKNPGATNVTRLMGPKAGKVVFALDFFKGFMAAGWPMIPALNTGSPMSLAILGLTAAVIGHSYSIFLHFQGGKAVATAMGGLMVLMPWAALIGFVVWYAAFRFSKYVSLSSILFAVSLPISAFIFYRTSEQLLFVTSLALFIIVRHHENIIRLIQGKENHFKKKKLT